MIWLALYHVLLAGWAKTSPSIIVRSIAALIPFWIVWLLLFVNLGFCLWQRLPAFLREVRRKPLAERRGARWTRAVDDDVDIDDMRRTWQARGYRMRSHERGLRGVRRRWGALGTVAFHLSLFVMATGLILTLLYREQATAAVAVGETLTAGPDQLRGQGRAEVVEPFLVEEIAPEFWGDELLFTSLSARVRLDSGERANLEINRPLWTGWGRFVRLVNFGYAPAYQLTTNRGRVVDAAVVKLGVFPPGGRDHFRPNGVPHRIYLEVYPDVPDAGDGTNRSLNLRSPLLLVRVTRGKLIVAEKRVRLGEPVEFEGLQLRFSEIRYFGEFELLTDPGSPILFAGFALAFLGLVLRMAGRRAEVVWRPGDDGFGGELTGYGAAEPPDTEEAAR